MSTPALCETPTGGGVTPQDTIGTGRVPGRRRARGEVGRVRVGVRAPVSGTDRGRRVVDGGRCAAAFVVPGGAVPDQVGDGRDGRAASGGRSAGERRRVTDDRDLAARDGEVRRAGRVGRRQGCADGGGRRELHEVVPPGCDRPGQGGRLPGRPAGRGVLDRPAADVDGGRSTVEQLDEVVREARAGVAATGVDLADDDVGRRAAGGRDDQHATGDDGQGEEEKDYRSGHDEAPIGRRTRSPSDYRVVRTGERVRPRLAQRWHISGRQRGLVGGRAA